MRLPVHKGTGWSMQSNLTLQAGAGDTQDAPRGVSQHDKASEAQLRAALRAMYAPLNEQLFQLLGRCARGTSPASINRPQALAPSSSPAPPVPEHFPHFLPAVHV